MKTTENQGGNLPALFVGVGKKVATYLVIVLFFNGLIAWLTYNQLEDPTKTFSFSYGTFFVNEDMMGIPFFSLGNLVLLAATAGSAVLNWSRNERS
jgi:hypothetical protein